MQKLPSPEVYEQEFTYFPWGILIEEVQQMILDKAPKGADIIDLMCGPGYLLAQIKKMRRDLILEGVDIDVKFINYAMTKYPDIHFQVANILKWEPSKKYDIVLCTAGIHHLPYREQEPFLKMIPTLLKENGFAIFADPYIDNYSNESERMQAAAKLGYEYLIATINNDAPNNLIKAAIDILHNDVMGFEYKTALTKLEPVFRELFSSIEVHKTWPNNESEYGDYYIVANK